MLGRFAATALALVFAGPALASGEGAPATAGQHAGEHKGMAHTSAPTKTLYERLGGQPAVSAVVDDFAARVLADGRINKKFAKSDPARLVAMLKDFVCSATGGPCTYTGLSMKDSHHNMGVTEGEFAALVEDLVLTLDKFSVPKAEKDELLAALGPLAAEIVEVKGPATGTPLPPSFKPAPRLKSDKM